MKNKCVSTIVLFFFAIGIGYAQFKDLVYFNGINGGNPTGSLTLVGNTLFGMTAADGGTNGYGTIFAMDTNGGGFKDLFIFNGTNGQAPYGSLINSGNKLYGMVSGGGKNSVGCIFSINFNGGGFKDLLDFNDTNGESPMG